MPIVNRGTVQEAADNISHWPENDRVYAVKRG